MTYEQFWDMDCTLVKAFQKADEYRKKEQNTWAWVQGMYIYDALTRLAPIFMANPKKGMKPKPYSKEPFKLFEEKEEISEETEIKKINKGKTYMEMLMANINERFEKESK